MHFLTIVALPPGYQGDIEEGVVHMMEPFDENAHMHDWEPEDEQWTNAQSLWDWYQIGGRWTGHLGDYDPEADPANREVCEYCGGTGDRPELITLVSQAWYDEVGCNGCRGTGIRVKWPTEWVQGESNVARLGDVREILETEEGRPYYLVAAEAVERAERRNPDFNRISGDWSKYWIAQPETVIDAIRKLSDDCTVVVVDCHS